MSTRYDCIVPSEDGARVLVVGGPRGSSLPFIECARGWIAEAAPVLRSELLARHGIDAIALRQVLRAAGGVTCELELLSGGPPSSELSWEAVADLCEELPEPQRGALRRWRAGESSERELAPWQRRGWYSCAVDWCRGHVLRAGGQLLRAAQVKGGWNGSCVLEIETSGETLYLKASTRRKPGEPYVIRELAESFADHLPDVVAADDDRCWTLMRAVRGRTLEHEDPHVLGAAAELMGRLQVARAASVDAWLARGCVDRSLHVLERALPRLLLEIPNLLVAQGVIGQVERSHVAALLPRAARLCRALERCNIPPRSIHHEDFRAGNVIRTADDGLVITDWNDTVVAHPFFSVQRFLWFMDPPAECSRYRIGEPPKDHLRAAVRDGYLRAFAAYEVPVRARMAFDATCALAPVYDVLRFDAGLGASILKGGLREEEAHIARDAIGRLLEVETLLSTGALATPEAPS